MAEKTIVKSVPGPKPAAAKPAPAVAKTAVAKKTPTAAIAAKPKLLPVEAKPAAKPKPVAAPIAKAPVAQPVTAKPTAEAPVKLASLKIAPLISEGNTQVTETFTKIEDSAKNFAAEATSKVKAAMEKGSKGVSEMVEFSKGNVEAVVASGKIAAKGAEEIAKYATDYGRSAIEKANETAKLMSAVKSPTEFFQLQSDMAKTSLEAFVGEASKFGENYMKLLGEIAQPIQSRYALAVEKVKTAVAV